MTADQIKAADIATVSKMKAAGHQIQFSLHCDSKKRWSVGMTIFHRNDTRRLDPQVRTLDAWHPDATSAKAYARIMGAV